LTIVQPPTHVVASAPSAAMVIAPGGCDGCSERIAPPTTAADPHSGYRDAPNGSVSKATSSSATPMSRPLDG
jgi:hypothetical protein